MPKKKGNYINIFGVPRVGVVGNAGTFFGGGKVGHYEFLQSLVGTEYDQKSISLQACEYYDKALRNPNKYWGQIITLFNFIGVRTVDEKNRIIKNDILDFIYDEYEKNNSLPAEAFFHYLLCTFQYPHPSITKDEVEKSFNIIKPYKIILELLVELNKEYNKSSISYTDIVWLYLEHYNSKGNFLSETPIKEIAKNISESVPEKSDINEIKIKSISYFRRFLECSNLLVSKRDNKTFELKYDAISSEKIIKSMKNLLNENLKYHPDSLKRKREYEFSRYIFSEKKINTWLNDTKLYKGLNLFTLVGENAKEFSIEKYTISKLKQQLDRIDNFDIPTIVKKRSEQHILRNLVYTDRSNSECAICGKEFPIEALRTAHIKKRSLCNDIEKKDTSIVMPACLFGCDYLFEKGYLIVKDGEILANFRNKKITENLREIVESKVGKILKNSGIFSYLKSKPYFDYHRTLNTK